MTTILPAITGKKVDKGIGAGSVAIISDEALVALSPVRVNGIPNCIHLRVCEAVPFSGGEDDHESCLGTLYEDGCLVPLTRPMMSRSEASAWTAAADLLSALAAAARARAGECPSPKERIYTRS